MEKDKWVKPLLTAALLLSHNGGVIVNGPPWGPGRGSEEEPEGYLVLMTNLSISLL